MISLSGCSSSLWRYSSHVIDQESRLGSIAEHLILLDGLGYYTMEQNISKPTNWCKSIFYDNPSIKTIIAYKEIIYLLYFLYHILITFTFQIVKAKTKQRNINVDATILVESSLIVLVFINVDGSWPCSSKNIVNLFCIEKLFWLLWKKYIQPNFEKTSPSRFGHQRHLKQNSKPVTRIEYFVWDWMKIYYVKKLKSGMQQIHIQK